MQASMLCVIAKQFQVFKSVVVSYVIDVMNAFWRNNKTAEVFFHHKDMLKNVPCASSLPVTVRMVRHVDINVAVRAFVLSFKVPRDLSLNERPRIGLAQPLGVFVPGGATWTTFQGRADALLVQLRKRHSLLEHKYNLSHFGQNAIAGAS